MRFYLESEQCRFVLDILQDSSRIYLSNDWQRLLQVHHPWQMKCKDCFYVPIGHIFSAWQLFRIFKFKGNFKFKGFDSKTFENEPKRSPVYWAPLSFSNGLFVSISSIMKNILTGSSLPFLTVRTICWPRAHFLVFVKYLWSNVQPISTRMLFLASALISSKALINIV